MGVIKRFGPLPARFRACAGLGRRAPTTLAGGLGYSFPASRHPSPWTSCRRSDQVTDSHQIVGCHCPGKHPGPTLSASMPRLPHQADRLHPAEDFLDPFALLLAQDGACMVRGAGLKGPRTVRVVLRHVRRGAARANLLHPIVGVVVLVGSDRDAPRPERAWILSAAASRSALPLASVRRGSTTRPLRFS